MIQEMLAVLLTVAIAPAAPGPVSEARFRVIGRSLAEVYVDAGQAIGILRGDRLLVVSGGATIAELEVLRVEAARSACRAVSLVRPITTGDLVARAPTKTPVVAPPPPKATTPSPTARDAAPPTAPPPTAPPPTAPPATAPPATAPPATAPPATAPAATAPARAVPVAFVPPAASPALVAVAYTPPAAAGTAEIVPIAVTPPSATKPAPARAAAFAAGEGRTFNVRYRSTSNVYLDGGRAQGLSVGDRLQATATGAVLAELEVVYVAEQSASCRVVSEARPLKTGDPVVRVGRAAPVAAPAASADSDAPAGFSATGAAAPVAVAQGPAAASAAQSAPASRAPGAPWARVRGSAAVGYYQSSDRTGTGLGFNERTARVDLAATDIDGQPLSFTLRGRSRQDVRDRRLSDRTPQSERADRLYEVALRYDPPSGSFELEAGRIGLYRFVGIGYLDGALARYRASSALRVGAFGGRAAEIESLGFNGTGAKYGAFLQLAPGGRYSTRGYDALLALVRENADGDVSREYLSLESRFSGGRRWSLFERAELDLNRGWRKEATGQAVQLSNVSLSGNLQLARAASAFVSYDGRRNYRYYRNRLVPEEVFDDLLHQGLRAGVNVSRAGGFGASAGVGMSLKEQDPRHPELNVANAYSWNGGVRHASLFGLSVGLDGAGFSNGYADGGVLSARAGRRFGAGHLLDVSYGRSVYRVTSTQEDRSTQWLRFTGRFELGRHAYVTGDLEYDKGDDLEGPRGLVEAGWIF